MIAATKFPEKKVVWNTNHPSKVEIVHKFRCGFTKRSNRLHLCPTRTFQSLILHFVHRSLISGTTTEEASVQHKTTTPAIVFSYSRLCRLIIKSPSCFVVEHQVQQPINPALRPARRSPTAAPPRVSTFTLGPPPANLLHPLACCCFMVACMPTLWLPYFMIERKSLSGFFFLSIVRVHVCQERMLIAGTTRKKCDIFESRTTLNHHRCVSLLNRGTLRYSTLLKSTLEFSCFFPRFSEQQT